MTAPISDEWRELLLLLPGYDPFRDAEGCWFDAETAQLCLDFFPECLCHIEGALAGQPFTLERWQRSFLANLVGWKMRDEIGRAVRRYREGLLYVPRKNGKTPLVAGLGLFILFCDDEAGQQDYIAAGEREQAGKLFRHAKGMVERDADLKGRCRIYGGKAEAGQSRSIVIEQEDSFLRVISADASGEHGGNTHLGIIDELHVQPDRDLYDVLKTSTASLNRRQPLLVTITTADFNRPSLCNEVHDYACKVRDGVIQNPRFLPAIWELTDEDDWTDERTWAKVNPNLGVSVSMAYLREECGKAKENPAYENTFRRLHLNQKTETDVRAIPMDRWDASAAAIADPWTWRVEMIRQLRARSITPKGGLDLGSTADLTALALLFPWDDGAFVLLPWLWAPRSAAEKRERKDRVPYLTWAAKGWITLTAGDVTDYAVVRRDVVETCSLFAGREVAVDRLFQGAQLCTELMQDGLDMVAFGQGFLSMAAPTKRFLELVIEQKLLHGGNPVLRWMASSAATEEDAAGNIKFSKKKSTQRIDGIVAGTMALGRWMVQPDTGGPLITVI